MFRLLLSIVLFTLAAGSFAAQTNISHLIKGTEKQASQPACAAPEQPKSYVLAQSQMQPADPLSCERAGARSPCAASFGTGCTCRCFCTPDQAVCQWVQFC